MAHNSYTSGLPDMCTLSPWASGVAMFQELRV